MSSEPARDADAPVPTRAFPARTELPDDLVDPAKVEELAGHDALQIRETVTRVYLAEDSRNFDAFHALLTQDFVQIHGIYGRVEGPEAFIEWLASHPEAFDRYRHMALNTVTSARGPDAAEALSYIVVLEIHPGPEVEAALLPRILAHGVVRDTLRKEEGRWRISRRIYDQFAVTAAAAPDEAMRWAAAQPVQAVDDDPRSR